MSQIVLQKCRNIFGLNEKSRARGNKTLVNVVRDWANRKRGMPARRPIIAVKQGNSGVCKEDDVDAKFHISSIVPVHQFDSLPDPRNMGVVRNDDVLVNELSARPRLICSSVDIFERNAGGNILHLLDLCGCSWKDINRSSIEQPFAGPQSGVMDQHICTTKFLQDCRSSDACARSTVLIRSSSLTIVMCATRISRGPSDFSKRFDQTGFSIYRNPSIKLLRDQHVGFYSAAAMFCAPAVEKRS